MLNGGVSQFVPKCPVLSPFVLFCPSRGPERGQIGTKEDKRGQNGTFRDKLGNAPFSIYPHPDLPFLAFLGKARKNHPKKQGFFLSSEPLKSLGKKGKTLKKARKFFANEKNKEIEKSKERKIRVH